MDYTITTRTGITFDRYVWTGGDSQPKNIELLQCYSMFRELRREYFRESMVVNRAYWGCVSMETVRILWNRARLDAWRTITEYKRVSLSDVVDVIESMKGV